MKLKITGRQLPKHQIKSLVDSVFNQDASPLVMTPDASNKAGVDWSAEMQSGQQQIPSNPYIGYPNNIPIDPNQSTPFGSDNPFKIVPIDNKPKKPKMTGYEYAGLAVGAMGVANSILSQSEQQKQIEKAKRYGYTDSAYGSYTPSFSRGYQEINRKNPATNYSYPQFAGTTVAPLYGFAQEGGVLMPQSPMGAYEMDAFNMMPQPIIEQNEYDKNAPISTTEQLYENTKRVLNIKPEAGEISYTHNNPLNVHYGSFASKYGGLKGSDDAGGNVAVFPDLRTGIKANTDLLFGPAYVNLPISKARNKWVKGNPNTPDNTSKQIVKEMGKDVPLAQLTPKEKDKLFKLFAKFEGKQAYNLIKDMPVFEEGGEYELDDEQIKQILKNGGRIEYL